MDNRLIHLTKKLSTIRERFKANESIWYELRDAASPPEGETPDDPKNGRRDMPTYDHVREVLAIELLFLQIEIELLKLGGTSKSILENLKEEARSETP